MSIALDHDLKNGEKAYGWENIKNLALEKTVNSESGFPNSITNADSLAMFAISKSP